MDITFPTHEQQTTQATREMKNKEFSQKDKKMKKLKINTKELELLEGYLKKEIKFLEFKPIKLRGKMKN